MVSRKYNFSNSPQDFLNSLKELEGNFIKIKRARNGNIVLLHNPSIRDFLNHYIESNPTELHLLCEAVVYYDHALKLCSQLPSFKEFGKRLAPQFSSLPTVTMNLIDTKGIRLTPAYPEPGFISLDRAGHSLEQRMAEILPHIVKWQDEKINEQFEALVDKVIERMSQEKIERLALNILATALGSIDPLRNLGQTKFVSATKEYYFRHIKDLDDFNFITSLAVLFPGCISEKELNEIQKLFESIYPQDVEAMMGDGDLGIEDFVRLQESLTEVAVTLPPKTGQFTRRVSWV